MATFASNVHRIQQIMDAAVRFNRKVCVVGRSMINNVAIASRLGYLTVPDNLLVDVADVDAYDPERIVIISTGSQGEPMAALTRMAMAEHRKIEIESGDTVIISASPIPGNERLIGKTINHLFRQGAHVIYHSVSGVHVSGHASQEELKLMLNLTQPRYFIPIHGEYRMLVHHARLAEQVGIPKENIILTDIGDMIEMNAKSIRKTAKVEAGSVMVDGLGVGDVGTVVLRDRQQLAQDGILVVVVGISKQTGVVVSGRKFISRVCVYEGIETMIEEVKAKVVEQEAWERFEQWSMVGIRCVKCSPASCGRTRRHPMILPVVMKLTAVLRSRFRRLHKESCLFV